MMTKEQAIGQIIEVLGGEAPPREGTTSYSLQVLAETIQRQVQPPIITVEGEQLILSR